MLLTHGWRCERYSTTRYTPQENDLDLTSTRSLQRRGYNMLVEQQNGLGSIQLEPVINVDYPFMPGWCINKMLVKHKDKSAMRRFIRSYQANTLFQDFLGDFRNQDDWVLSCDGSTIGTFDGQHYDPPEGKSGLCIAFSTLHMMPVKFYSALIKKGFEIWAIGNMWHYNRVYEWSNGSNMVYELDAAPERLISLLGAEGYIEELRKAQARDRHLEPALHSARLRPCENAEGGTKLVFVPVTFVETMVVPGWCINHVVVAHEDERKVAELISSHRNRALFDMLGPQPTRNEDWTASMDGTMIAVTNDSLDPNPDPSDYMVGLHSAVFRFSTLCSPPVRWFAALEDKGFVVGAYSFARHFGRFCSWVDGKPTVYKLNQIPQSIDLFDGKGYLALLRKAKKQFRGYDLQPFRLVLRH